MAFVIAVKYGDVIACFMALHQLKGDNSLLSLSMYDRVRYTYFNIVSTQAIYRAYVSELFFSIRNLQLDEKNTYKDRVGP